MPSGSYQPVARDEDTFMIEKHVRPKRPLRRRLLPFAELTVMVLLGAALGIAGTHIYYTSYQPASNLEPSSVQTDSSSPIPASVFEPRIPTVMRPDERYIGRSKYADRNWWYLTRSSESVFIPNAEDYGLAPGFARPGHHINENNIHSSPEDKERRYYHISNLHQLHCLNIVRIKYYDALHNVTQATPDDDAQALYHVEHCVEYLRQSIMCGDHFAVEAASPPGSPPEERADAWGNPLGWGVTKRCVSWDNLMSWQRRQREVAEEMGA